ncbi:MAG TPA: hypothetical protein VFG37_02745 [Planctomycetota bacterium]|nr:hypothetical protein [Planctomycetota bacterium]
MRTRTRRTLARALCAMLPDVDVAWNDRNEAPERLAHRGFTHSLDLGELKRLIALAK